MKLPRILDAQGLTYGLYVALFPRRFVPWWLDSKRVGLLLREAVEN